MADTHPSAGQQPDSMYEKRIPIHPRSIKGSFRTFKTTVLIIAYIVYFGLPWVPWARNDAPDQAVLFDLVGRRFFIFDMVVYPQDIIALSFLLFIAAVTLFFVTGLVGRAFCGYFCFQTLWTDAFMFIERWVQGERPARQRLYKQPWNGEKIARYGMTHALFLLFSWWTALTFVLYFGYAPELLRQFFDGSMVQAGYVAVLALTVSTYLAAALLREQVCFYMCPYARFQGVMYESETLVVTYEEARGEGEKGRVAARAGLRTLDERHAAGHGDCIDCGLCHQVCPTGIDIRDGLQYKCISCGLCIDACNTIMDKMGYPRGLVRYDSEINMQSANPGRPHMYWLRLRTVGYGGLIVVMTGILIFFLANRTSYEETIRQVRSPLFVELSSGEIRNRYEIRITNKTDQVQRYSISAEGVPAEAVLFDLSDQVEARSGKTGSAWVSVVLPPEQAHDTASFDFIITPQAQPEEARRAPVRFYSRQE